MDEMKKDGYEQKAGDDIVTETDKDIDDLATRGDVSDLDHLLQEIERLKELLVGERIKVSLVGAGVDPKKISRAARLVDAKRVCNDCEIDRAAFEQEVKEIFEEFPELKMVCDSSQKGFRIGSDGVQKQTTQEQIWNAFGN